MDLIREGNEIILKIVNLLNEVSPDKCPTGIEFTNFVAKNADRFPVDIATVISLAADIEGQLMGHEGTVH